MLCHDGVVAGGELCYETTPVLDDLGVLATGVWTGDVDGDMDADVIALMGFPASLAVMLGDGVGNLTFDGTYVLEMGADTGAQDVAVGDMDGDGWVDAVVAFDSPPSLRVLSNDGLGGFGPPMNTMLAMAPLAVEVVDFDLDGNEDAIVSDDAGVWIHYGLGNGSFGMALGLADPALVEGRDLGLEDFDGDGVLDVAVAFTQTVAVFPGDGMGGLLAPWTQAVPVSAGGPQELAIGDVTLDGIPDIVVADDFVDQIHELTGVGNGTFVLQPMPRTGAFAVLGEGNSDCETDIYTRGDPLMPDALTIYPSDGMGGFDGPQDFPMHAGMVDMSAADFNGDGLDDIVFVIGFSGELGLSAAEP